MLRMPCREPKNTTKVSAILLIIVIETIRSSSFGASNSSANLYPCAIDAKLALMIAYALLSFRQP